MGKGREYYLAFEDKCTRDENMKKLETAIDLCTLPNGWVGHVNAANGLPYYYNAKTEQSTYEKPDPSQSRHETVAVDQKSVENGTGKTKRRRLTNQDLIDRFIRE